MKRSPVTVPFGYEPPDEHVKGTLVFYDAFEDTADHELLGAEKTAEERRFSRFVLYPLHEETAKRMLKAPVAPFYKRERRLESWKLEHRSEAVIEVFEAKRKKYTPMDTALRHLTDKYPAPHFLYLTPDMANLFASYSSFREWIAKLRLILSERPKRLHPRLEEHRNRWDVAGEEPADDIKDV
ncbi:MULTISPECIES: hypothetical protein [Paenibacillus]|uniref:Uncharacterized protein n=1 Tax=Paenibacillus albilobatus TaxID=2716884 RepID=A0A919XHS2_9BACL|nr:MULTISPECIES: hypothetical protein [Paenibacillus]GIO31613.1 hypothetical protein J2TS6_27540 [Paenibacillus albilobatus]